MNVQETVLDAIGEVLSRDAMDLGPAFRLAPSNDVAPIDVARIAIACEHAFGLQLHDEVIAAWETIGDVLAHVEGLLEAGDAEPTERTDADRTAWYYE